MSKKNTQQPQSKKTSQPDNQQPNTAVETVTTSSAENSSAEAAEETEVKPTKAAKGNFGNLDKDKKYDLSKLKIPKDHYVVRHFSTVTLASGQTMEDPTTSRFQVYDKETYGNLTRQHVKDGKQVASQFENLGIHVDVLHDPTK